jgi:hypothetical protein
MHTTQSYAIHLHLLIIIIRLITRNQEIAPSPLSNAFINVIDRHFAYLLSCDETPLASII